MLYGALSETLESRVGYVQLLTLSYQQVESGQAPRLRPASEKSSSGLLHLLHLALAAEVYKETEILAGLCLSAETSPPYGVHSVLGVPTHKVNEFFHGISAQTPLERILKFFPYPSPGEMNLAPPEESAVRGALEATSRNALRYLLFLKKQREFLKPFRNKFSHSFDFAAFSHPSAAHQGRSFLPLLSLTPVTLESGTICERLLLPSFEHHTALFEMHWNATRLEMELIHARTLHLLNGRPVFPAKIWWDPGYTPSTETQHLISSAAERQNYVAEWNGEIRIRPPPALFLQAEEFYVRRWTDETVGTLPP